MQELYYNGKLILGVDHGYGNMKTAHRVFATGVEKRCSWEQQHWSTKEKNTELVVGIRSFRYRKSMTRIIGS